MNTNLRDFDLEKASLIVALEEKVKLMFKAIGKLEIHENFDGVRREIVNIEELICFLKESDSNNLIHSDKLSTAMELNAIKQDDNLLKQFKSFCENWKINTSESSQTKGRIKNIQDSFSQLTMRFGLLFFSNNMQEEQIQAINDRLTKRYPNGNF